GDRARRIAECRMYSDIIDTLAVDIDLATVAQASEIFLAGERPPLGADGILGLHGDHMGIPRDLSPQQGTRRTGSQCAFGVAAGSGRNGGVSIRSIRSSRASRKIGNPVVMARWPASGCAR